MELKVKIPDRRVMAELIQAGYPRPLARVYAARGVQGVAELAYKAGQLASGGMKDLDKAAGILEEAIRTQRRIAIVGDYDCDGATATAVMVRGLRSLGAQHVNFMVPNRFKDGYGLTESITEQVVAAYHPDVLITVDNGISSLGGVAAAKAAGMTVIVTDHHLAGTVLPAADAILDPNQPDCPFPWKSTAGVGVAFYLILQMYRRMKESRPDLPNPSFLSPLVALGTIADVVPLEYNNRILVYQGLSRWRKGEAQPGLLALAKIAKRDLPVLTAGDIAFQIGPRLNAAGRMDDMTIGIRCLLTEDPDEAARLAKALDDFNKGRREVEKGQCTEALGVLGTVPEGACGLTALLPDGHLGVIGIVAGRIRETFNRPAVIFAADTDKDGNPILKASARSIPGFHLRDALADIATEHPEWFKGFGGHAMAAGLSLDPASYKAFAARFDALAAERIPPEAFQDRLETDGILGPGEITEELAEAIEDAGIWGQHFPEPTFMGSFPVLSRKDLKGNHIQFVLELPSGDEINAILFGGGTGAQPGETLRTVYTLGISTFKGVRNLQLRLIWAEADSDQALEPGKPAS